MSDRETDFLRAQSDAKWLLHYAESFKSRVRLLAQFPFDTLPEADARRAVAILRQTAEEIEQALAEVRHDRAA